MFANYHYLCTIVFLGCWHAYPFCLWLSLFHVENIEKQIFVGDFTAVNAKVYRINGCVCLFTGVLHKTAKRI